jgi:DNA-directed RNA polymerase III subunit RPC6
LKDAIYPINYSGYPTIDELQKWIRKSGMTTIELSAEDVACLLDRLVFDGKIIKLPRHEYQYMSEDSEYDSKYQDNNMWMFKAAKYVRESGNFFTDIPCGKCPVFEFCKEGGPVNPADCVYLSNWLAQDF